MWHFTRIHAFYSTVNHSIRSTGSTYDAVIGHGRKNLVSHSESGFKSMRAEEHCKIDYVTICVLTNSQKDFTKMMLLCSEEHTFAELFEKVR